MAKKVSKAAESEPSFEEALERVEGIIARIESGEVGLEDSIDEYEKGVALLGRCREILDRAEQRVEDLTSRMRSEAEKSG
jgi:exodeoxyribonuclease VII small subunit